MPQSSFCFFPFSYCDSVLSQWENWFPLFSRHPFTCALIDSCGHVRCRWQLNSREKARVFQNLPYERPQLLSSAFMKHEMELTVPSLCVQHHLDHLCAFMVLKCWDWIPAARLEKKSWWASYRKDSIIHYLNTFLFLTFWSNTSTESKFWMILTLDFLWACGCQGLGRGRYE